MEHNDKHLPSMCEALIQPPYHKTNRETYLEAREIMAQGLGVFITLAEDPNLVPSTHMTARSSNSSSRVLTLSSGHPPEGPEMHVVHILMHDIGTHKVKS